MDARILLVEDDAVTRRLLASGLATAGYRVQEAPSGEDAIAMLDGQPFDLVISDIRMRRVDGLQVLQAARARPESPAVVLLTGYSSVESAVAALRLGASDYLTKPCELRDLLACVERALQRRAEDRRLDALRRIAREIVSVEGAAAPAAQQPPPPDERPIRVGPLTIDPPRRTAAFDGRALRLTPIEYALLHCLAEEAGRVVGYQAIVRRTHGVAVDDEEAQVLLRSHVHNLRHKIDPGCIVAVRGAGYMLRAPGADGAEG